MLVRSYTLRCLSKQWFCLKPTIHRDTRVGLESTLVHLPRQCKRCKGFICRLVFSCNFWPSAESLCRGSDQTVPDSLADTKEKEFQLIDQILGGFHELFYDLIAPYERRVFVTAFDILQVEADAEEVAQETFLKAFRSLRSFRREAKFSTWLLRITLNEARMRLRKRKEVSLDAVFPNHEEADCPPLLIADWQAVPGESLFRDETRRLLRECIASLPETYREVITLRDLNGLNNAETAETLGLTAVNTKVRLLRARLKLRDLLVQRLRRKAGNPGL